MTTEEQGTRFVEEDEDSVREDGEVQGDKKLQLG